MDSVRIDPNDSKMDLVDQAGAVGVDRLLVGPERVGRLAPLAQADQRAGRGAEVVVGDDFLAAFGRVLEQGLRGIGRAITNRAPLGSGGPSTA